MLCENDPAADDATAILLVGHGSPKQGACDGLRSLRLDIQSLHPEMVVEVAFLNHTAPTVQEGFDSCVARGAERVLLYPFFLHTGVHVERDLPQEIEKARKRYDSLNILLSDSLGVYPGLAEVVLKQVKTTLRGCEGSR